MGCRATRRGVHGVSRHYPIERHRKGWNAPEREFEGSGAILGGWIGMKGTGRMKEAPEWILYGYIPSMARERGRFDR